MWQGQLKDSFVRLRCGKPYELDEASLCLVTGIVTALCYTERW